jgi:hypothetical protein
METEKFLIQGIIFQDRQDFRIKGIEGITIDTSNGTGSVKSLFHGTVVFEKKESARHGVCGEFSDRWGKSKISKFLISETQLSFYKTYEKRPAIEYSFDIQIDGLWYGNYKSPEGISGTAKCYVQTIPDTFFIPIIF